MHAYLGHDDRRPAPLILGHEAAGDVIEGPLKGTRVTINPLVTCQKCKECKSNRSNLCGKRQIISMQPREGAFAEMVRRHRQVLWRWGPPATSPRARPCLHNYASFLVADIKVASTSLDVV